MDLWTPGDESLALAGVVATIKHPSQPAWSECLTYSPIRVFIHLILQVYRGTSGDTPEVTWLVRGYPVWMVQRPPTVALFFFSNQSERQGGEAQADLSLCP